MSEDVSAGEQVDEWEFLTDGKAILKGKSIGRKRIRLLDKPCDAKTCELRVLKSGGAHRNVAFKLYLADEQLAKLVRESTTQSGETDTAKWMTGVEKEKKQAAISSLRAAATTPPAPYPRRRTESARRATRGSTGRSRRGTSSRRRGRR